MVVNAVSITETPVFGWLVISLVASVREVPITRQFHALTIGRLHAPANPVSKSVDVVPCDYRILVLRQADEHPVSFVNDCNALT